MGRFASALAELHAAGLVYGDSSPNNFLASEDPGEHEVRLIDADNVRVVGSPEASVVFTPAYGAPELVRGSAPNTIASDVWALFAIAFQVLTLNHPMVGDLVANASPSVEDAALAGELPWIDDELDSRNKSSTGLPRSLVLSPRLRRLARQCFEKGRQDASARPSAAALSAAFRSAARLTLRCATCEGSFFATEADCPWCGAHRHSFTMLTVNRWDPDAESPLDGGVGSVERVALSAEEELDLEDKDRGLVSHRELSVDCRVSVTARGLHVWPRGGSAISVRSPDGTTERQVGATGVLLPVARSRAECWRVHLGRLDEPHLFLTAEHVPAGHAAQ
jgi:serine/threonine protein kinase